jgi:diaminopimelate decarboxylase
MIDARPGEFSIGGADARALAERFGTPLFVYDADVVRNTWRQMRACFDYAPSMLHYAAVSNPNLHLLRLLRAEGACVHANTPGDIYCALRAGFSGAQIVLSGSNLGDEDLAYADQHGVHVNVDSLDDLRRACAARSPRDVGLRIHLANVLPESRIGVREHEVEEAVGIARSRDCRITSLHVYCGTHASGLERYRAAVDLLVAVGSTLADLDCLNIGGGFGYDYRAPDEHPFPFAELASVAGGAARELSRRRGRPIALRVEPGRSAVAGAAVLLTRVRSVKRADSRRYVGVDTTTANFTSPVVYGAHRRVVSVEPRGADELAADVCGCTTYSRDVIAQGFPLPSVQLGDLLAILDVGAYGYCMASHFLNRPRAAEVFVDRGEPLLVTRRETFEDLVRSQVEPPKDGSWLDPIHDEPTNRLSVTKPMSSRPL